MPRFVPVQCSECSVLQIKPAQKRGLHWCCSMCRKPEPKVHGPAALEGPISDVCLFVEELGLAEHDAEEMAAVANTFRGVENLDGAADLAGLYLTPHKPSKRVLPVEVLEDAVVRRGKESGMRSADAVQRRFGSQPKHFLSSLWGRWHQKACSKEVVELMEFAGGNDENVPPPPRS